MKIKSKARQQKSQRKKDEMEVIPLWSQIMEASFVRFITANWILPMGFLVTRVVLGLMGKTRIPQKRIKNLINPLRKEKVLLLAPVHCHIQQTLDSLEAPVSETYC